MTGILCSCAKRKDLGDGLGGAGQGDGVGLLRGKPFVAGVLGERGGLERNFSGQEFFKLAEQHAGVFQQFKNMNTLAGSQKNFQSGWRV